MEETFQYQITGVVLFVFKKIIRHQFPVSRHHFSVPTLMFGRPQRQWDCKKIHAPSLSSLSECSSYRNQQSLCTVDVTCTADGFQSRCSTTSQQQPQTMYWSRDTVIVFIRSIAPFAITINSNVCPHIRVPNMLMRDPVHDVIGIFYSDARN